MHEFFQHELQFLLQTGKNLGIIFQLYLKTDETIHLLLNDGLFPLQFAAANDGSKCPLLHNISIIKAGVNL